MSTFKPTGPTASDPRSWHKLMYLQEPDETNQGSGAVNDTWTDLQSFRGSLSPKKGAEAPEGETLMATMHYEIWTWDIAVATAKHRVRYGTRIFEIVEPPYRYDERGPAKLMLIAMEVQV